MQLIVLGMHRSGTSVLGRLLNMMGAYFAPEGMSTGANSENPKGFWERKDVRALNDFVLQSVSCDWNRVSAFNIDELPAEVVEEFMVRAARIVLEMDAHRPWFLKEPRLCLLLALWRRVLETPVCIHIHRSPVEVAASLQTRNRIPIEVGMLLWQRYVVSAHEGAAGLPAVTVAHRDLMTAPMDVVLRLHRELAELGVAGLRVPLAEEVGSFVREELYRERELRDDLLEYRDAPQTALHGAVAAGRRLPARFARLGRRACSILDVYESGLPPVVTPQEKRRADARRKEQALAREQALDAMLPAVDQIKTTLESQTTSLQRIFAQTGALEETLEIRSSQVQRALEGQVGKVQEALEGQAGKMQEALESQAGKVQQALDAQVGTVEKALETQASVLTEFRTRLDASRERESTLNARIEALMAETIELQGALAARDREAAARSRESASLRDQLRSVSDEKAAGDLALQDRFREIAELCRMLEEAELGLHARERELTQTRRRLEGVERELAGVNGNFARTRSEHATEVAKLRAGVAARQQRIWQMKDAIEQLQRRKGLLEEQARVARTVVKQERATIESLEKSHSWRITSPLRWTARLVGGGMRGRNVELERDRSLVRASGLFDDAWYLVMNPDVHDSGVDPVVHYLVHGAAERRDPSVEFSTRFYLDSNPDVAETRTNPLVHYILHGAAEGRATKAGPER